MPRNLSIGVLFLFAAASVWAGSVNSPFTVRVTLNPSSNTSNTCVSASGTGAGSTSVQVTCTNNVYVNIVKLSTPKDSASPLIGRFVTGFRLARSSSTSSDRVIGQFDDTVAQEDQGWNFEGQIYSGNANPERAQRLARWQLRNSEGTVTALRVVGDDAQAGLVEMLVSF